MNNEKKREDIFAKARERFGFVPNVIKELAVSPAVAEAYLKGLDALDGISLTKQELQAVSLAASAEEGCSYCKTAHTAMGKAAGLEPGDLELIKAGKDPVDERLKALVCATRFVHKNRGRLTVDDVKCIEGRGVSRGELYEIIAVIANKVIPTYVNHIAGTRIDQELIDGACCPQSRVSSEASADCCCP